jgi:RNA methyltransferase, TrmH family
MNTFRDFFMLSKSNVSFINSLKIKKYRENHQQFIAEGSKLVLDLLQSSYNVKEIFALQTWIEEKSLILPGDITVHVIGAGEMSRITSLSTPSPVLAVVAIPENKADLLKIGEKLILVLDDIRDPGNLGTILRIADWFGIKTVICSETTVDLYNPKVVQASMGSITRVQVVYSGLEVFFTSRPVSVPVYGTFLTGKSIYCMNLDDKGILIFGNEANGISKEVEKFVTDRIFIPSFASQGDSAGKAESLNASVAAAIVCSEFRRQANPE